MALITNIIDVCGNDLGSYFCDVCNNQTIYGAKTIVNNATFNGTINGGAITGSSLSAGSGTISTTGSINGGAIYGSSLNSGGALNLSGTSTSGCNGITIVNDGGYATATTLSMYANGGQGAFQISNIYYASATTTVGLSINTYGSSMTQFMLTSFSGGKLTTGLTGDLSCTGKLYPYTDNTGNLGSSGNRWANIYSATSVTVGSDANLKTEIASLSENEMNVAIEFMPLLKTYKLIASVAKKGDSARTHAGIIAQSVQQAFWNNGLNPYSYSMFCSDTWVVTTDASFTLDIGHEQVSYDICGNILSLTDGSGNNISETNGIVSYTDGSGNVIQQYTGTITTQLSIRYDELYAFLLAASDSRLSKLESIVQSLQTSINASSNPTSATATTTP